MEPYERLRYYRTRAKLTLEQLAEKSDISAMTIRRIENGEAKLTPKYLHMLTHALNISPFAITRCIDDIRMETVGDLMGVLVVFLRAHILVIDGNRSWESDFPPETVRLKLNPDAAKLFTFNINGRLIDSEEGAICIRSKAMIRDLLIWEKTEYKLKQVLEECKNSRSKKLLQKRDDIIETINTLELEYQRNKTKLSSEFLY